MALATYDEIKDAVEAIQADDDSFKPLILTLGGAHWIATTVHGTMTALADLGWDALEAVVETALAVPPWMTGKLTTFVRRLFDLLQDGVAFAAEAAEEVAETETLLTPSSGTQKVRQPAGGAPFCSMLARNLA